MKTVSQMETEAILSMAEAMKALEQQLADAKARIDDLEKIIANQRAEIKELQQSSLLLLLLGKEMKCNPHPNAPHGYLRDASHDANRYVCECEWWNEKDYELATLEEAEEFARKRNYIKEE